MKITDLLDCYADEAMPFPQPDSPDAGTTVMLTMKKLGLRQTRRRLLPLRLLAAACLILTLAATALAVGFTVWDRARQDAGIDADIAEYTEYRDLPTISQTVSCTRDTLTKVDGACVELVSTICAGKNVTAYLRLSPVSPDIAEADPLQSGWEIGGMPEAAGVEEIDGLTCREIRQLDYDAETQSALLCLQLSGDALEQTTAFSIDLFWNQAGTARHYGRITLPITPSEALTLPLGLPLENAFIPATATLSEVQLGATYTRFTLELSQDFSLWCAEHGGQDAYALLGDAYWGHFDRENGLEPSVSYTQLDAQVAFSRSWYSALADAAAETVIVLQDGSEISLADTQTNDLQEEASQLITELLLPAPLDLSQVSGITISGVCYDVIPG